LPQSISRTIIMGMTFPEKLVRLMATKGVTSEQLARICDVSASTVGNWRTGLTEPGLASLTSLARHFRVSLDYLALNELEEPDASSVYPLPTGKPSSEPPPGRSMGEEMDAERRPRKRQRG
jgi:transcriptional regulator with XRE-family HTH domain